MIPLRVKLKNFLCHAEQEFLFEGERVWLFHGPNGVGKSAVFDSILYAIYGETERRDGSKTKGIELIRHGETSLRVDFDFEYRGRRYRIWRTLTRSNQPKQGVSEFLNGSATPEPISTVNGVRELEKWVRATLGLTYDAFVSSALLRQGAAERLIDADKTSRRDMFRGIIDLDPYIRLHKCVNTARTECNGAVKIIRATLDGMPEISEEAIAEQTSRLKEATVAEESARVVTQTARERMAAAQLWDNLNAACESIRQQLAAASNRAARAEHLETAVRRLQDLRIAVPALTRIDRLHALRMTTAETLQTVRKTQLAAAAVQAELQSSLESERQQFEFGRTRIADLDRELADNRNQCSRLEAQIRQAENTADLHGKLAIARAEVFAEDLDERLRCAKEDVAASQSARDAIPHLEQVHRHRSEFRRAVEDHRTASTSLGSTTSELDRLRVAASEAAAVAEEMTGKAQSVRSAQAVAEEKLHGVRSQLKDFGKIEGETRCPRCLQEIGPDHFERERGELKRKVKEFELDARRCQGESKSADGAEADALAAKLKCDQDCLRIEKDLAAAERAVLDCNSRETQARTGFQNACSDLAADFAARVDTIETGVFPTEEDLITARRLRTLLPERTENSESWKEEFARREQMRSDIKTLEQAVQAVGAPSDVSATRTERDQLQRSMDESERELEASEKAGEAAERNIATIDQKLAAAMVEVNRLNGEATRAEMAGETAQRDHSEAVASVAAETLIWDRAKVAKELKTLEDSGAERDFEAVAEDRALQADRESRLSAVMRQIEEQVPEESRRPSQEFADKAAAAARAEREAGEAREASSRKHDELTNQRLRRSEALARLDAAERNHGLHDQLADLLGENGIQLDLVRVAEKRITHLANETLVRVSRGDLRFEPTDPASSQPFDVFVRRSGCPEPIAVGSLSGGQRCRVAIALALAVCRFASGEAHPLQSIIIDEAFANLDREGRLAMIEVINDGTIAGEALERIILVSHHEDVVAAFPSGYVLRNERGQTAADALVR